MADKRSRLWVTLGVTTTASPGAVTLLCKLLCITAKSGDSNVTIADQGSERAIPATNKAALPGKAIFDGKFDQFGNLDDILSVDPINSIYLFIDGWSIVVMLTSTVLNYPFELGLVNVIKENQHCERARSLDTKMTSPAFFAPPCSELIIVHPFLNGSSKITICEYAQFFIFVSARKMRKIGGNRHCNALVANKHMVAVIDLELQQNDHVSPSAVIEAIGGVISVGQGQRLSLTFNGLALETKKRKFYAELLELLRP